MLELRDDPFSITMWYREPVLSFPPNFQWPTDTAECIALSAKKWRFLATCCRALQTVIITGAHGQTCALCQKFGSTCQSDSEICPLKSKTGEGECSSGSVLQNLPI